MLTIYLEARHPAVNLARLYHLSLTQDLWGEWLLEITYGRIGSRGRHKTYAFKIVDEALPRIQAILSRRTSAPQRSGCQYQVIDFYQDPSLPAVTIPESLHDPLPVLLKETFRTPKEKSALPLFECHGRDNSSNT